MAKNAYVLMYNDGSNNSPLAVFRKKPSDKVLADKELAEDLDTVEGVREAMKEYLFWEKVGLY